MNSHLRSSGIPGQVDRARGHGVSPQLSWGRYWGCRSPDLVATDLSFHFRLGLVVKRLSACLPTLAVGPRVWFTGESFISSFLRQPRVAWALCSNLSSCGDTDCVCARGRAEGRDEQWALVSGSVIAAHFWEPWLTCELSGWLLWGEVCVLSAALRLGSDTGKGLPGARAELCVTGRQDRPASMHWQV